MASSLLDTIARQLNQPAAAQRTGDITVCVIDIDTAGQLNPPHHAVDQKLEGVAAILMTGKKTDCQVRGQLIRMLRTAVALQIVRAGAGDLGDQRQRPGTQRRILRHAAANHTIHAFGDQIHQPVAAADHQMNPRVQALKAVDVWQHDARGMGAVQIQPQRAFGLTRTPGHILVGGLQLGQNPLAALVVLLTIQRGRHLARGALQQTRAQTFFQRLDRVGCGRSRNTQVRRRPSKAALFDDTHEQPQAVKTIHRDCCS